ncbi:alpha/beta hydrolase [Flavobacterium sp. JP2137]|uniref:alpha/beta hydrolase n=1 Tax=Flavobacterium sp. JP2137 TaxID=3414510 RepID=UPI003D2FA62E
MPISPSHTNQSIVGARVPSRTNQSIVGARVPSRTNQELAPSLENNPWLDIPYAELLASDPLEIRRQEAVLAAQEAVVPAPAGLVVENRSIPGLHPSSPEVRLRVYRQRGAEASRVLLYFHGGGFVFGNPEQSDELFYRLAPDSGYTVVSVAYRLAPESPFPAAIEDGYAALLWLTHHGSEIGIDPQKIIVGGRSAGGALATALTQMARDKKGPQIHFQLLSYPVTDYSCSSPSMLEFTASPIWDYSGAKSSWKLYLTDHSLPVSPYASPLSATDFSNLPPAFIMACELDPLRDEAIEYAQKLLQAGVAVELQVIPGAIHVFDVFPSRLSDQYYQTQLRVLSSVFEAL